MASNRSYIRYTWFVVYMVFIVILAGGVVRMTQSGMGCPDWPTCFGRWVPPTSADQLPADYEKYLKQQDIDHSFNAYHTWIEYINRLLGALLGVFIFIHLVWSYRAFWKNKRSIVWLSLFLLFAVGFQGWLGKKVVDDNLAVVKVTTHMLVALLIAAIPLAIIYKLKTAERTSSSLLKWTSVGLLALLILQIVFGTQVREHIDEISKPLKYSQRETWIAQLGNDFIIHRSFSWLVAAACLFLCWKAWRYAALRTHAVFIVALVLTTILLGVIMAWYDIPALAQPMHLLLASTLALSVFAFRLRVK